MYDLRSTLGKEDQSHQVSTNRTGAGKLFNKSKNASMWAFDNEQEEHNIQSKDKIQVMVVEQFQKQLLNAYKKDTTFTDINNSSIQISFYQIIQHLQSRTDGLDELEYLLIIQENTQTFISNGDEHYQLFARALLQCLHRRIRKIKKKEKKNELQEYDKIIRNNFKKKSMQIIEQGNHYRQKIRKNSDHSGHNYSKGEGSTSNLNGSNSSTEGKLGKLLSNSKLKDQKMAENEEKHEESVSFTAMVANNMTVRQRLPKQKKKNKKQPQQTKDKGEDDDNNEAFIFFRPKAGKQK